MATYWGHDGVVITGRHLAEAGISRIDCQWLGQLNPEAMADTVGWRFDEETDSYTSILREGAPPLMRPKSIRRQSVAQNRRDNMARCMANPGLCARYGVKPASLAAAALGKLGGQSKSAAKAAAVRENGKLGGRPRIK